MKRRKPVPPSADEQSRLAVCDELTRLIRDKLAAPDVMPKARSGAAAEPSTPLAQAVAVYRELDETAADLLRRRLDDIEGAANVLRWLGRHPDGGEGVEPAAVRWIGEQLRVLLADAHAMLDQLSGRPGGYPGPRAETIVVDTLTMA